MSPTRQSQPEFMALLKNKITTKYLIFHSNSGKASNISNKCAELTNDV